MKKQEIKPGQGKRVKDCIKYANTTQEKLAELVFTTPQTISKIANEHIPLSLDNAVRISRALNVRLEFLLLEDDYMTEAERTHKICLSRTQQTNSCYSLIEALGYTIISTEEKPDGSYASIHRPFKRITVNEGDTPEQILENAEYATPVRVFKIKALDGRISDIEQEELQQIIKDIEDYAKFKCEQPFNRFKHIRIKPRRE